MSSVTRFLPAQLWNVRCACSACRADSHTSRPQTSSFRILVQPHLCFLCHDAQDLAAMAVRLASASQARCRWQRYLPAASPARMMCIMAVIPSRGPVDDRSGSSLPHRRAGGAWRGRGGTEIWMLIPFAIVHDRMRIGDGRAAGTLPP